MPFCPKCKYEYKEGVKVCSDCGVELVDSLDDLKIAIFTREESTIDEAMDFLSKNGVTGISKQESEKEGLFDIVAPEADKDQIIRLLNVYYREIHTATEEEQELAERIASVRSKETTAYVDSSVRAENYKSGAVALIGVGIIGVVALVLINAGVINVYFPETTKMLINIVMGVVFVLFVILGISSMMNYKKLLNQANSEDDLMDRINKWADFELDVNALNENVSDDDNDEIKFFNRTEALRLQLEDRFPDIDSSFEEHVIEELYDRIFGCE